MRPRVHVLLAMVSVALLVASLWIPRRIGSQEDLRAVELGLPFRFAVQNQSLLTPPDFPRWHAFISPSTHGYVEANAEMKRRTLTALPRLGRRRRSSPKQNDELIAFLELLPREHPQ